MDRAEQPQKRNGEKIRRDPRRIEGQARLRRSGEAAARRQPNPAGQPVRDERTPPGFSPQVRGVAHDLPRSRVERFDSRGDESELVKYFMDPISDMLTRI